MSRGGLRGSMLSVLALLVCAGAGPTAAGVSAGFPVSVVLSDSAIRVSPAKVPPGAIRFVVSNHGTRKRSFSIAGKQTRTLSRGGTQQLSVALRAGDVRYRSLVPGKPSLTRTGVLRVAAASRASTIRGRQELTTVVSGLDAPTFVTSPPGDPDRLLVVEQAGLVVQVRNGQVLPQPFLDIRSTVKADGEKGLLSIAFAPDYATSGLLYAYYNNRDGNIRVTEFHRGDNPDAIPIAPRRRLLAITKAAPDHNGGMMQFGPDGYLYIAVGDGGASPPTVPVGITGQTLGDLFANILRIDPRPDPYGIPPGNPFVGVPNARPEIVAYGLRNPWRFWIDPATKTMLIGDVGEGEQEEVDALPLDQLGKDFGWPCKEGTTVPPDATIPAVCRTSFLTAPLLSYPHSAKRCSITGGVTVRDPALPALDGLFLYADFCDTQVFAVDPAASRPMEIPLGLTAKQVTSFGADARGHVYVTTAGGTLYRIDP